MLWLIVKGASHQIISANIHSEKKPNGLHQLWVERPTGKTLKIIESRDMKEVKIVKDAIDYAIKHGDPSLELE